MKRIAPFMLSALMLVGLVSGCAGNGNNQGTATQPGSTSQPSSAGEQTTQPTTNANAKYKEDIIVGVISDITTLDPQEGTVTSHLMYFRMVFDRLLGLDTQTQKLKPELATEWHTDDLQTYTFKLREDAVFHNGEPVKASDVVWTFERSKGSTAASALGNMIEEIKAPDDYTVEIKLVAKHADFPYMLTLTNNSIMSEKAVTDDPVEGTGVGSGPFMVDSYEFRDFLKMTRNENYWGEVTPTKSVTFRMMPENSSRLIALETGEIDVCQDPDTLQLNYIDDTPGIELQTYVGSGIIYAGFNTSKPPFDNRDFRLAVCYAIDSQEIIDVARDGWGERVLSLWGWNAFGYNGGIGTNGESTAYDYNPELAKEYLDKVYPNGGAKFTYTTVGDYRKTIAELVQAQLKKIGIEIEILVYDYAGYMTALNNNEHEAFSLGFGFNSWGDDASRLYKGGSSLNESKYDNPRVNELADMAIAEADENTRKAYYAEIQQILFDDAPYLPMFYQVLGFAVKEGVSGIDYNPTSMHDLSKIVMVIE